MKSKFYRIFSLTLAMLLTVSLMACAGTPGQVPSAEPSPDEASGESAGEPSGETAGEVTGESDEASVPTREGPIELKIGISEDMDSLSPYTAILGGAFAVTKYAFYEYLCGVKEDGSLDPQIAKSWTTEDGYVYNVEIYDYITDSAGNHITAADIEWSRVLHVPHRLYPVKHTRKARMRWPAWLWQRGLIRLKALNRALISGS